MKALARAGAAEPQPSVVAAGPREAAAIEAISSPTMNIRRFVGRLAITIGVGAVLFAGLLALLFVGCGRLLVQAFDMCGNDVVRSVPPPDGRLKAVVFERDCGATTGFSTHVSILRAGEKLPNEAGNLFVADNGGGLAAAVDVAWTRRRQLLVRYDPSARVFLSNKQVTLPTGLFRTESVAVRYNGGAAPSQPSDRSPRRKP